MRGHRRSVQTAKVICFKTNLRVDEQGVTLINKVGNPVLGSAELWIMTGWFRYLDEAKHENDKLFVWSKGCVIFVIIF